MKSPPNLSFPRISFGEASYRLTTRAVVIVAVDTTRVEDMRAMPLSHRDVPVRNDVDRLPKAWDFSLLDERERHRVAQFHTPRLAERYRRERILLRVLLARILHREAADISYGYGRYGKPFLCASPRRSPRRVSSSSAHSLSGECHFSLSHTRNTLILALHSSHEIGVDCEEYRSVMAQSSIAKLLGMRSRMRTEEFITRWVWREAAAKCLDLSLYNLNAIPLPHGGARSAKRYIATGRFLPVARYRTVAVPLFGTHACACALRTWGRFEVALCRLFAID